MMRANTRPTRFGDDWTGVFIRGDDAVAYAMTLRHHLDVTHTSQTSRRVLEGLVALLESCNEHEYGKGRIPPDDVELQLLKEYEECEKT